MTELSIAFLFVTLAWWLSTGVIMFLCGLHERTFGWSLFGATVVLLLAAYGIVQSAWNTSVLGAYTAFLSALACWGWIEMSFLMGLVTGPRTTVCPPGAKGWHRFILALETLIYHEIAILVAAVGVVALTWHAPNQSGTSAFLVLMAMRISAKLNIFLGVPNLTDEFLPVRLTYLKSYFRKRKFNLLFPVSVFASAFAAFTFGQRALGANSGGSTGYALLFALLVLAIVEHLFMILPLPDAALWRWAHPASKVVDKAS